MDHATLLHDLTLMLLYVSSWEEKGYFDETVHRAWKGYDFETLDLLADEGFISGTRRAKSVYLEDEGVERAQQLLKDYGLELDPDPAE
ncbi:MAG: DUF6429 family protein [Coriobacteriales bacterium]|nr:DUF6429 family protein [Coriobacteriales bacterium]